MPPFFKSRNSAHTPPPASPSPSSRPVIGPPHLLGHSTSRLSSHGGATVQLVPDRSAAEHEGNNNDPSSSSVSSYNPLRKPLENINSGGNSNNSGGSNHGGRLSAGTNSFPSGAYYEPDRQIQSPAPPLSPQPDAYNNTAGISRRLSSRQKHQSTPNFVQQQQQQQPQQQQPDLDRLDPYQLQQPSPHSPGLSPHSPGRPQSMLTPPQENETEGYSVKRADTDPSQPQYSPHPQRHDSFHNPGNQQHQKQQGSHMMTAQPHNPPRRSMDVQPGPPSRDVSSLSNYVPAVGRGNTNQQDYQVPGGGQGGGNPPSYEPAKYEGQPVGRMTPESRADSRAGQALEGVDVPRLWQDYETLTAKYRKVKNLYFDRENEIERLQNTIAHQRISQSRTSLDDNEYANRFERLDGAIKNVAFEIRQSWKTIPPWLCNVINSGAELKGGREMTVVGRASISKWVVNEILEKFFHPALDINLSAYLKSIEHGIRNNAPTLQSIEDDDALSAKVCNWRLTTLDGLRDSINGPHAMEYRQRLSEHLVKQLVDCLQQHLHDPAPLGLLGGVQMIVDIAVGLAANLPLESRDVRVWYPLPGERFDGKFMKGEGGLPPLVTPTSQRPDAEGEKVQLDTSQQTRDAEGGEISPLPPPAPAKDEKMLPSGKAGIGGLPPQSSATQNKETRSKKIPGLARVKIAFQGGAHQPLAPNNMPQQQTGQQQLQQLQPQNGNGGSQVSLPPPPPTPQQDPGVPKDGDRVRVAGFMACEVRGKLILVKAPVWL